MKTSRLLLFGLCLVMTWNCADEGEVAFEEGSISVRGFDLPEECRALQLALAVEQVQNGRPVGTLPGSPQVRTVRQGQSATEAFPVPGLNFAAELSVSVTITSAVGGCGQLKEGDVWKFAGEPKREGEGRFSVAFSDFELQ